MSKRLLRFTFLLTFFLIFFVFVNKLQAQAPVPAPVPAPGQTTPNPSPACIPSGQSCGSTDLCCVSTQTCFNGYCTEAYQPPPPPPGIAISTIGNLAPDESKSVTTSNLGHNQKYSLVVSKLQPVNFLGTRSFVPLSTDCLTSNDNGDIAKSLGPYRIPGRYHLEVSTTVGPTTSCIPGQIKASQDFSVGKPTDQYCCKPEGSTPIYNADEDMCQQNPFGGILAGRKTPNECKKTGSFCEPQSSECFKTKTITEQGKICIFSTDADFNTKKQDTNQYIICSFGGGETCSDGRGPAIKTAIGCVHTSPPEFVKDLMKFVIGIGGGLAFLMMLLGAYQMLSSAGNPETLKAGQDRLTSAVTGLLFIIFAVLLLQIIGLDILAIPGFGK